jgi:hypothetical protein
MRKQPTVEQVDVVIGPKDEERLVTVAKPIADRWPDVYRPPVTESGNPTAAAKRATDDTDGESEPVVAKKPRRSRSKNTDPGQGPAPITDAADLPFAGDTTTATAAADSTAGTAGVTTEGATPDA